MNALFNRVERRLANFAFRNDLVLKREAAVVSFTFDDAPQTACELGRDILEERDCLGTWYIAGGLTNQLDQGRLCHSVANLRELLQSGHHIGCHTYSHRRCDQMTRGEMQSEIQRNATFFHDIGVVSSDMHFSYPLGAFDLASKRQVAASFASTRLTTGGMQTGVADLNGLLAQKLYACSTSEADVRALIDANAIAKGWLIFYTHDVELVSSEWGCTPSLLRAAVGIALDSGCKVLPVNLAIDYWRNNLSR